MELQPLFFYWVKLKDKGKGITQEIMKVNQQERIMEQQGKDNGLIGRNIMEL